MIFSARKHPIVRIASARISGFGSSESCVSARTYLDKGVHCENHELRLCLGVVHEVEVDELLLLQILRLHVFEHVGKERRDVLADGHVGNDPLDAILAFLAVLAVHWVSLCDVRSARNSKVSPMVSRATYLCAALQKTQAGSWRVRRRTRATVRVAARLRAEIIAHVQGCTACFSICFAGRMV